MEFVTTIQVEQVKQVLNTHAHPMKYTSYMKPDLLFVRWLKNGSFELLKTGGVLTAWRPGLPFVGKLIPNGRYTIISGRFALARQVKIMLACFDAFVLVLMSFLILFRSSTDFPQRVFTLLFMLAAWGLWVLLGYALLRYLPTILQKQQQREVLAFIEEYLVCKDE